MAPLSHYKTLGIDPEASGDDIRNAYRKLAKKYHPDTNHGDERSEEPFKRVAAAYSALSDPNARQQYDKLHAIRKRRAPAKPKSPNRATTSDNIDVTVKRTRPYRTTRRPPKEAYRYQQHRPNSPVEGRNVKVNLFITLEEAYKGGSKQIKFQRDTTCGFCGGIGRTSTPINTCQTCNGAGIVELAHEVGVVFAPGVRDGDEIRMIKAGHMGTS